ncbi:unnamed protein product [Ceutorhynchus assimilis]|uniref:1-Cys peroxiredoxin n=1 Tax=Ceutorhynchus assimilis TaxID=467358 RepID=A0A9P0GX95_9CUCU|nr:unnamed protein product [Ceutorhynchus assimilis]
MAAPGEQEGNIILGSIFPNCPVSTTIGDFSLHQFFGDSWGILFSHPADFTPVCTTELARVIQLAGEFAKRNCKVIALSCNIKKTHLLWQKDIQAVAKFDNLEFPFPIIEDNNRELAIRLQMLDPSEKDSLGLALPARAVFFIDPEKKMRASVLYPATTGRNFDEILRMLDSMQLCDKYRVATPEGWKKGDDVMVQPNVTDEESKKLFSQVIVLSVPSGKEYMKKTSLKDI